MRFNYDQHGQSYAQSRQADPRIAKVILEHLGHAKTVLNVGAGAGSYEPADRHVVAVEPSAAMRSQRPRTLPPAIHAMAEALPFDDAAFDAAMAILTVHHWPNRTQGLRELRRVTQGPIVVMTFDPEAPTEFWMRDYCPEIVEVEHRRYGPLSSILEALGGRSEVISIEVPRDCTDLFQVALYARPEAFLDPVVRQGQSAWKFLAEGVEERCVRHLRADLESGEWDKRYGHLRERDSIRCQLRLVVAHPQ